MTDEKKQIEQLQAKLDVVDALVNGVQPDSEIMKSLRGLFDHMDSPLDGAEFP